MNHKILPGLHYCKRMMLNKDTSHSFLPVCVFVCHNRITWTGILDDHFTAVCCCRQCHSHFWTDKCFKHQLDFSARKPQLAPYISTTQATLHNYRNELLSNSSYTISVYRMFHIWITNSVRKQLAVSTCPSLAVQLICYTSICYVTHFMGK